MSTRKPIESFMRWRPTGPVEPSVFYFFQVLQAQRDVNRINKRRLREMRPVSSLDGMAVDMIDTTRKLLGRSTGHSARLSLVL